MSAFLRYLAVVCLAVTLTAVLAGSDELAGDNWPVEESCSTGVAPIAVRHATPTNLHNKKIPAGTGNSRTRCAATSLQGAQAPLENS
jgi:hypothetical protein